MFENFKKHESKFELYCEQYEVSAAIELVKKCGGDVYAWNFYKMKGYANRVVLQLNCRKMRRNSIVEVAKRIANAHEFAFNYSY